MFRKAISHNAPGGVGVHRNIVHAEFTQTVTLQYQKNINRADLRTFVVSVSVPVVWQAWSCETSICLLNLWVCQFKPERCWRKDSPPCILYNLLKRMTFSIVNKHSRLLQRDWREGKSTSSYFCSLNERWYFTWSIFHVAGTEGRLSISMLLLRHHWSLLILNHISVFDFGTEFTPKMEAVTTRSMTEGLLCGRV